MIGSLKTFRGGKMIRKTIIVIFILIISVAIIYLFNSSGAAEIVMTNDVKTTPPKLTMATKPKVKKSQTPAKKKPIEKPLNEALTAMVNNYKVHLQYPPFSQPILTEGSIAQYQSNNTPPVTDTLFVLEGNENQVRLSLHVDKNTYCVDEIINIQLSVSTESNDNLENVTMWISDREVNELHRLVIDPSLSQWKKLVDTKLISTSGWPLELEIRTEVTVNGERLYTFHPFRLQEAVASLTEVGNSSINNEYLVIPLNFEVEKAGYYFVSAILYDKNTDSPLIYLSAEGPLSYLRNNMKLQAHIRALKYANSSGPYVLKSITIHRSADIGEEFDLLGKTQEVDYEVNGHIFDNYLDTPYQDPNAADRIEVLKGLAFDAN